MNVHNPGQMPLALILSKTHKQLLILIMIDPQLKLHLCIK